MCRHIIISRVYARFILLGLNEEETSMKISNGFKRFAINAEAFVDGARSHFTSVGKLISGATIGALGLATMFFASDNALDDFVEEKAKYEALELFVSFPDQCDFDGSFYFAQRGPDNKYGLYAGSYGHYEPLNKSETADFVEDYESCMQALRMLPKLQQDMHVNLHYRASQPLRRIDTKSNDADDVVNWRELTKLSGAGSLSLADMREDTSTGVDVVSAFEKTWADAISDFEDGKIYDHAGDENVTTFTYQDSYKSYNFGFVHYGALGFGLLLGLGCGFWRDPSQDYTKRGEDRDARRKAIEHDNFKF
jgi:hypothetical protein